MAKKLQAHPFLLTLLILVAPAAAQKQAFVVDGELKVSPGPGEVASPVPLPFAVVATFGVAGGDILVGAETAEVVPNSDAWGGVNLWSVNADREPNRLSFGRRVLTAAWSDEAGLVVYWTRNMRIFVTDSDARETRRILDRGAAPAFSPDGSKIAYARPTDDWQPGSLIGGFDIHVYDVASGEDRELTQGFDDSQPIWTPDGSTILFLSGQRTGVTSFWKVSATGGTAQQLTNFGLVSASEESFVPNPSRNIDVQWSSDGSMLLYGARYSEAGEVVVLEFDQEYRAVEARILAAGRAPMWGPGGKVFLPGTVNRSGKVTIRELSPRGSGEEEVISIEDARSLSEKRKPLQAAPAKSASCSAERFRWPIATYPASGYYYYDNNNTTGAYKNWKCSTTSECYDQHRGTDIPVGCGTVVLSGSAGTVSTRNDGCADIGALGSTCGGGFGNYVKIDHGNSWFSIYAHMKNGTPKALGAVGCGVQVGLSCSSGNSSGPHLHFEVQKYAAPGNDPFSGSCSGTESFWCNQNGGGTGKPSTTCCCT